MTKVDIISGFLGAGKTTFIKLLIENVFAGEKLVLIENEFGEIGIDGGFLKDAGIEITEMNSGCICCTLVGDFSRALQKVIEEYHPDRVLIEPSGVGKLSDVARAVERVKKEAEIEIDGRITIVDGKKAKMYLENFGEFYRDQVAYADTIVMSRTQLMEAHKIEECVKVLREENKEAAIISTPWDKLSSEAIEHAFSSDSQLEGIFEEEECPVCVYTTITMKKNVTTVIIMKKNVTMSITMKREHVAVVMSIITIIMSITMRMKYLQAGDRRPLTNIQRRNLIFC